MMEQIATRVGIVLPERFDLLAAGAAVVAILLAGALGWAAGRWLGPRLAAWWERRLGARVEGFGPRLCVLTRYLVAWLVIVVTINAADWPALAGLLLGLAAAVAAALAALNILRGLQVARTAAVPLALIVFVAVLADSVGGLAMLSAPMDDVAFTIGARRITLLDIVRVAISLAILYLVVRFANRVVAQLVGHTRSLDPAQRLLAQKLAQVAILIAAFFIALSLTGIDLTALAFFGGAFGLAVGFGLQKTVGNLFAGIILLMDRSVKPGDVIVVGDSFGQVTKIGVRAVSVVTRDGKEHLIPNENLMTQEVENWSYSSRDVRIHIPVGVSYDADLPLAQRLMIEAAEASSRVLKAPRPSVWLLGFGESSVDHDILVWISDPEAGVGNVQSEILNRLWQLFRENGIEIPYAQRDIRVKEWPGAPPPASADPQQRA